MVLAQEESARTNAEKQVCNFIQLLAVLLVKQKVNPNHYSLGNPYALFAYRILTTVHHM